MAAEAGGERKRVGRAQTAGGEGGVAAADERGSDGAASGLVIGPDGALPVPWLDAPLEQALAPTRGHAQLARCAPGAGALSLALCIAQSRLCEALEGRRFACGRCGSCRLVQARGHPDLFVLLPQAQRRETGWLLADDQPEGDEAKRKWSRQIRIDEVRALLDWVTKTSARGRGKMVVLHPAEALNLHAASALLKTIEEPPAGTRLVLTCSDVMHVLPTVRSRCQQLAVPVPAREAAIAWLAARGVKEAQALLAACDGRPLDVLGWMQRGVDAQRWRELPAELAQGRAGALAALPVPLAVEVLLKVCHDAMAQAAASRGRYFESLGVGRGAECGGEQSMPAPARARHERREGAADAAGALPVLVRWQHELLELARAAEHPWHEGLAIDALVSAAQRALCALAPREPVPGQG
jgi:DNA polymerase-3 subunit delta'